MLVHVGVIGHGHVRAHSQVDVTAPAQTTQRRVKRHTKLRLVALTRVLEQLGRPDLPQHLHIDGQGFDPGAAPGTGGDGREQAVEALARSFSLDLREQIAGNTHLQHRHIQQRDVDRAHGLQRRARAEGVAVVRGQPVGRDQVPRAFETRLDADDQTQRATPQETRHPRRGVVVARHRIEVEGRVAQGHGLRAGGSAERHGQRRQPDKGSAAHQLRGSPGDQGTATEAEKNAVLQRVKTIHTRLQYPICPLALAQPRRIKPSPAQSSPP